MGRMIVIGIGLAVSLLFAAQTPGTAGDVRSEMSTDQLEADFERTSLRTRPFTYWFWMNGNITKEGITKDLEAMHRIGVGGVFNLEGGAGIPEGPVVYLSEEWAELKGHAIKEAARLGIDYIMHNCPGWSSSGGPWVTPEMSMQRLFWSEVEVEGGKEVRPALPTPRTPIDFRKEVAVLAFPSFANGKPVGFSDWRELNNSVFNHLGKIRIDSYDKEQVIRKEEVIDLTSLMDADGVLTWDAPPGNWTVMRIVHSSTGQRNCAAPDTGAGLECDKFSKEAIGLHFEKMMDILHPMLSPCIGLIEIGLEIDSWEVGMQNWTSGFERIFKEKTGYDIISYLPAMTGKVVGGKEETERFLWDLRRVQADLLADNYYGEFDRLCNQRGLSSYCEPYDRGPMEELQVGSRVDGVMGEFWNGLSAIFQNNLMMRRTTKLASSIAHINGQRIVGAEAYTSEPESGRWREHPFGLKAVGDKAFTEGINRMVVHRYAMQPHPTAAPGMTLGPWGIHFDRTNTLWEPSKAWMDYLNRCQTILQEGLFVADLAYFTGENVVGYTKVHRKDLSPAPPEGYDYDLVNAEVLIQRASVKDGRLCFPDGMSYKMLVLQDQEAMSLDFLRRLRALVEDGLVVVGRGPRTSLGLSSWSKEEEAEFDRLRGEIWRSDEFETRVGKGRVFQTSALEEVFAALGLLPDFEVTSNPDKAPVRHIHRKIGELDAYFLSNQRRSREDLVCRFRVAGKVPEFWDPVTGERKPAPAYSMEESTISVPLTLEEYGSVFVVFRPGEPGPDALASVRRPEAPGAASKKAPADEGFVNIHSDFSISLWAKPESDAMLATDNPMGYIPHPWTEYYAIHPSWGEKLYGTGHATCGLAVGRNGVAVWENSKGWPQMMLAREKPLSGWSNVCVVYEGGACSLYINGELSSTKVRSSYIVHPGLDKPDNSEGVTCFNGDLSEPLLFDRALSAKEVRKLFAKGFEEVRPAPTAVDLMRPASSGSVLVWENGHYELERLDGTVGTVNVEGIPKPMEIAGGWDLSLPMPSSDTLRLRMPGLGSLHRHRMEQVRHFSGTAVYRTEVKMGRSLLGESLRWFLDLGRAEVLAEVILNGKNLGIVWARPLSLDVTDELLEGSNTLEVRVTNQWTNRLIGDELLPEENPYSPGGGGYGIESLGRGAIVELPEWYVSGEPKPSGGRSTFTTWKHYRKDSPLIESGLIGPVRLIPAKEIPTKRSQAK